MSDTDPNTPDLRREDALKVQELHYARLTAERDRLREARGFFARQLGPLPTFAGISVALVSAFSDKIKDEWALWIAFVLLILMVATSTAYSGMPPYRRLRAYRTGAAGDFGPKRLPGGNKSMTPSQWYDAEITLEEDIYGIAPAGQGLTWQHVKAKLPSFDPAASLQEQLDRERFGVFAVQFLFVLVIVALLVAR